MKKIAWYFYCIDHVIRRKMKSDSSFSTKRVLSCEQANELIKEKLQGSNPFFMGRVGLFEMAAMRAYEFCNTTKFDIVMNQIYNCAGFFPKDDELGYRFLEIMKEALEYTDALARSMELCENYFYNRYMKPETCVIENFNITEPWKYGNDSWTTALKGKKVLVIHPFELTITNQYNENRDKLFKGTDILPEFKLLTYKTIQTTGDLRDERFETWFDALDFMSEEILKMDFDVALIGCGAYGFPIGASIRKSGRQAIHLGGNLQILFGIMGKRWDGTGPNSNDGKIRSDVRPYYNEYWCYPDESETPMSARKVEYGPYWK